MNLLNNIVEQMLKEHEGGEKFFNNLDNKIREEDTLIYDLVNKIPNNVSIVVSGGFGLFFYNLFVKKDKMFEDDNVIVVNGSLRIGQPITDLTNLKEIISGKEFIFIDDSYYSGKTKNIVKEEIEKLEGKLTMTYVVYDGAKDSKDVVSLYKYYK